MIVDGLLAVKPDIRQISLMIPLKHIIARYNFCTSDKKIARKL